MQAGSLANGAQEMRAVMKNVLISFVILCTGWAALLSGVAQADLFETYPNLKDMVYKPEESNWKFGLGISPIGILKNRFSTGLSLFQLHWIRGIFDIELFNATFFVTQSSNAASNANSFAFRMAPKIRVLGLASIGPLVGFELVSFPNIESRLNKDKYYSPYEKFSSSGIVYGASVSEMIELSGVTIKINQNVYRQTYSVVKSREGWTYDFKNPELRPTDQRESLTAGTLFNIEIAFLF